MNSEENPDQKPIGQDGTSEETNYNEADASSLNLKVTTKPQGANAQTLEPELQAEQMSLSNSEWKEEISILQLELKCYEWVPLTAVIKDINGDEPRSRRNSKAAGINAKSLIEPPVYRFVDSDNYYEVIDGNHRTYFLRKNVPIVTHVLAIVHAFLTLRILRTTENFGRITMNFWVGNNYINSYWAYKRNLV